MGESEAKAGQKTLIENHFPIVLACNGKPQVLLDQDTEAWARRLVVLEFKKSEEGKPMGRLADVLCQTGERNGAGTSSPPSPAD